MTVEDAEVNRAEACVDSSRPRLAFIVTSHVTAVAFLPGFTRHLAARGWDVTVICAPGEGVDALPDPAGVRVRTIPMRRDPDPVADAGSLVRLVRALREIGPDLVVTATPKAGLLGTVAARMVRAPRVVHLMWGLRSETLTGLRWRLVRALETATTRLSCRVIACSHSLGRALARAGMVRPDRLVVLGSGSSHGVDLVTFAPGRTGRDPSLEGVVERLDAVGRGPVVGFVGRLTPDKGVGALLDSVERLNATGCPCRLLLVGATEDDAIAGRVERAIVEGAPVVLIGSDPQVLPPYGLMDVHCLPTLREGFPNVSLEASACAVPTVTTDATGAVDSVLDGVTGLIARKGDAGSLTAALRTLLEDAELRARFGRAARRWVEGEFGSELVWRRHEEYLRQLIDSARVSSAVTR